MQVRRIVDVSGSPTSAQLGVGGDLVAWAEPRRVHALISTSEDERAFETEWDIERIEVSRCGRYVLALGDEGQRGAVWDVIAGTEVFALGGDDQPRWTLRAGFLCHGARTTLVSTKGKTGLVGHDLATRASLFWTGLAGVIVFLCEGIRDLGSGWVGVLGYRSGEQHDSFVTVPFERMASYEGAVQEALLDRTTLHDSGDRLAIGPCGAGFVAEFRDALDLEERDPHDLDPLGPVECFRGLCVWDIAAATLVQRIEYNPRDLRRWTDRRGRPIERQGRELHRLGNRARLDEPARRNLRRWPARGA